MSRSHTNYVEAKHGIAFYLKNVLSMFCIFAGIIVYELCSKYLLVFPYVCTEHFCNSEMFIIIKAIMVIIFGFLSVFFTFAFPLYFIAPSCVTLKYHFNLENKSPILSVLFTVLFMVFSVIRFVHFPLDGYLKYINPWNIACCLSIFISISTFNDMNTKRTDKHEECKLENELKERLKISTILVTLSLLFCVLSHLCFPENTNIAIGLTTNTATEIESSPHSDIATNAILGIKTTTEEEPLSQSESTYYVTPYGEKYHKKTCRYIREAKNGYREITETQAKRGYTACKICKP